MTFTVRSVSCQTNLSTDRWTCTAVVDTDADAASGRVARTWLVIFEPITHPASLSAILGIVKRNGVPELTVLDLEAMSEGVTVMPDARRQMASWLPVIAAKHLADQEELLRSYAASYAERNAAETRTEMLWRREELIDDINDELILLGRLRPTLPGLPGESQD